MSSNYLTTGNLVIISLLPMLQLFVYLQSPNYLETAEQIICYCAPPNYLATAHRQLFCYCASPISLATAQLQIICLLHIDQLFDNRKSSNYLATAHRTFICLQEIVYLATIFR